MPVEGSGHVAIEIREVSELAKIKDLRRPSRPIVESQDDGIYVWVRTRDRLGDGVALSAGAHWSA
jgi:hypothetical protein